MVVGNIVIGDHFWTCHSSRITLSRAHTDTHDVTDRSTHSSSPQSFENLFRSDKFCTISQRFESHVPKTVNIHEVIRLRNYEVRCFAGVPPNEHCMAWKQRHVYLIARRCSRVTSHCSYAKITSFSFSATHSSFCALCLQWTKGVTLFTETTTWDAVILSVWSLRVIYIRVTHQSCVESDTALLDGPWLVQTSDDISRTYCNQYGTGYLSRYSDSLQVGQSGNGIPVGATLPAPVQNGLGGPLSLLWVSGYFLGVERASREVNPSLPCSDEVKNWWSCASIPYLHSQCGKRDSCIFTLQVALSCTQEVPGSNLGWKSNYPEDSMVFLSHPELFWGSAVPQIKSRSLPCASFPIRCSPVMRHWIFWATGSDVT